MSTNGLEVFDKTLETTHIWLKEIMEDIGPDRHAAWHVLSVVLQRVRDRLPLPLAAHLGAQLPMLIRGVYYDQFDPAVSDIMVNGPEQTYVERKGKLEIAQIQFRDEEHLFQIAQRIVNKVGRRIDQTTPLCDARLQDGSRVNVIIPPLSLRGTAISIRKFSEKPITLDMMRGFGSMSEKMATVLKIAGATRMNVIISGGTGSGKTTMLNALSKMIDPGERVITIEDAAELRLQQPHWLPLETRPANLEGQGAITIRDLVINALRMRPIASSWARFVDPSASISSRP
jgi:uncharacterized protein (DUF2267 family)